MTTTLVTVPVALAVAGIIIAVDVVLAGVYLYGFADLYVPKGTSPGWSPCPRSSTPGCRTAAW